MALLIAEVYNCFKNQLILYYLFRPIHLIPFLLGFEPLLDISIMMLLMDALESLRPETSLLGTFFLKKKTLSRKWNFVKKWKCFHLAVNLSYKSNSTGQRLKKVTGLKCMLLFIYSDLVGLTNLNTLK